MTAPTRPPAPFDPLEARAATSSRSVMRALSQLLSRMSTAILLQTEAAYLQNDRMDALEAQNAALTARVEALEAARGVTVNAPFADAAHGVEGEG